MAQNIPMKKDVNIKKTQMEGQIVQAHGEAEKQMNGIRQSFVERGPDGMDELLSCFDGPIAVFVKTLSEVPFTHLASKRPQRSIQEQIITLLKKSGADSIEAQYTSALRSSRGAFFDSITADMFRFSAKEQSFKTALWRALIIQDPAVLLKNKVAVEYVVNGMLRRGFDFLGELVDDWRGFSDRRKRKTSTKNEAEESSKSTARLNELRRVLAANWTNPQFPLWLMQTSAICSFLKLLGVTFPSAHAVDKLIERAKLTRGGLKNPIKKVGIASKGSKIWIFTLKGRKFLPLHGKTSPLNFTRPLAKLEGSKVILSAFNFERQRRELIRIRKSAGESSKEFDNAWKSLASHFNMSQISPFAYRIEVEK